MKKIKRCHVLVFFSIIISSGCGNKLLNPLKGSSNKYMVKGNKINSRGTTIYLMPNKSLKVRAVSNAKVLKILSQSSVSYIIISRGKISVSYGNLAKCFVKDNDSIKRGQIIAELFAKDSVTDNSLEVSIEENGSNIIPNW
jgi:hypothetical protein